MKGKTALVATAAVLAVLLVAGVSVAAVDSAGRNREIYHGQGSTCGNDPAGEEVPSVRCGGEAGIRLRCPLEDEGGHDGACFRKMEGEDTGECEAVMQQNRNRLREECTEEKALEERTRSRLRDQTGEEEGCRYGGASAGAEGRGGGGKV